jgi:hypothetical protein
MVLRRLKAVRSSDFFSSAGLATGSLTDIAIPPQGVFFFSSEGSTATGN